MIFVVNENGHYFCISQEAWENFDLDYLQRSGCDVLQSREAMYQAVVAINDLSIEEVEGNEITINLDSNNKLTEVCPRGFSLQVEDDYPDDWLAAYQL